MQAFQLAGFFITERSKDHAFRNQLQGETVAFRRINTELGSNYEDEKWKHPSMYVLSEKDREIVRHQGLKREYPNPYYYGLEVKTDIKLPTT